MTDYHTRVFFVVDAPEVSEELFEELELAVDEYQELRKLDHEARVRICLVRHAYKDGDHWNYEDYADTFTTVKQLTVEELDIS